jgi:hypothetical protein
VTEGHSGGDSKEEVLPRPLRPEERDLLLFLLQGDDFPGREVLLSQVDHTTVVSRCGCGCPSVGLSVDRSSTQPAVFYDDIPVEGVPVGEPTDPAVLLFVRDGYLDDLEMMYLTEKPPSEWPPLSQLKVAVR